MRLEVRIFSIVLFLMAVLLMFNGCKKECTDCGNNNSFEHPWPDWTYEPWVWEDESTQTSAIDLVEGYLDHDIPVGVVIIDSPWETGYNTFEFDKNLFPNPKEMVDHFHSLGIKVFLWITTAINTDITDLYEFARENNYFMKKDENSQEPAVVHWWKGDGSLIDYFNPDVVSWWHSMMDKAIDLDIDGWKCDGTDFYVNFGASYSPYLGKKVKRNDYSERYYRDMYEHTTQRLNKKIVVMARPVDNYGIDIGGNDVAFAPKDLGWAGWVGDQDATFEGLKHALNNMYYSSQMGYLAFGSDIGGYREDKNYPETKRSKELFIRWAQLGAFTPIMENGGGGEHRPWKFDEETLEIYRTYAKLHHKLVPFLNEKGSTFYQEGKSLTQFISKEDYSYILAVDIFVAPMLDEGQSRSLTLPEKPEDTRWVYLFDTTKVYNAGETVDLEVPLDEFPVFVKEDSTILNDLLGVLK